MLVLVLGLVLFLGTHAVRIVADGWRSRMHTVLGERRWKAAYSALALIGFVLIVYGYGLARQAPVVLWSPPTWTRHVAALLMLPSFVLVVAGNVPGNALRARLGHPMVLGTKMWALAHLLANGTLADVVLFGSFLAWAVLDFRSARRRDRTNPVSPAVVRPGRTALVVIVGTAAWAAFAFWLHEAWIGVRPFG